MSRRLRVGICGLGVAGTASAILLARAGHEVTLLERAPQVGPVGAGFLLQPSGQRVMREMGLLERVIARSARIDVLEAFTETGWRLTELRYGEVAPDACAFGVPRGALFEILHAEALNAGARVELAADVQSVNEQASEVSVIDLAERTHRPFDLLIGADGARSRLRRWLNPHEPCRARGFAAFRDEVLALCPQAESVIDSLGGFEGLTFAGYQHAFPSRVHSSRVVLIGDAAHSMSPHLGQGANLALLDAESLVRHLAALPIEAALAAYAQERRAQARYFMLLSRWLSPFFQSNSRMLGWGRDLALPAMCAVPWIRWQMELSVAGAKRGFFDRLIPK